MNWKIVTDEEEFKSIVKDWQGVIACDTETYGKAWDSVGRKLLGISLSPEKCLNGIDSIYIPVLCFVGSSWNSVLDRGLGDVLLSFFKSVGLVGHNFTYDKRWIELFIGPTRWVADTRIMWHLASAPAGPRPYGLKDAQTELLGWGETNEKELEANVRSKGGLIRNGDHYLADLEILAKYACLDTYATMQVYKKLRSFFDANDYWSFLSDMMAYNELLEENTHLGLATNVEGLQKAHKRLLGATEAARKRFLKLVKPQIEELELDWVDRHIAKYKREYNKIAYVQQSEKWKRFNPNSDPDKRELFYGKLGFQVVETTEGGKPSTSADALKLTQHPCLESYLKYEHTNTLATNFSGPYLDSIGPDGRLHPGFNICGTVSYRLSGFKPYLLNAPFDQKIVMKNFECDPGWIGVHADLASIEPCITAHYSEDPFLMKVFGEGLGDIYLDLALELLPHDKELQNGYDPRKPITKAVKERFTKQRKMAKVIQLAVQYTGTGHTVSRNLTKEGIPTTVAQAEGYVRAYWRKFRAVDLFNQRLRELNRRQGSLRNVIGRIIRVPDPEYKDLSNRFIQSSAHDVLVLWVLEIYRMCREENIPIKPVLLDCHDSTSNQTPIEYAQVLQLVYTRALQKVVDALCLSVKIKAEIKTFLTLAGLKADE